MGFGRKTHSLEGEKIIKAITDSTSAVDFLVYAKICAVSHHEKWDGNGYPHGLKGEEIPLLGRIMAIADVYDALVSDRPYRKAFSHEKATEIIFKNSGTHFDPKIVDVFMEIKELFKNVND
jgi:putative two-component system response regulator